MPAPVDRSMMQAQKEKLSSAYLGKFDKLWTERTIILSQHKEGVGVPLLPLTGMERQAGGFSLFPISVQATYMDSALVNSGVEEFSHLASMTEYESEQFRANYNKIHPRDSILFIWVELQTTSTKEFLNIERWTIFLENDEGKQSEPAKVIEHPVQRVTTTTFSFDIRRQRSMPMDNIQSDWFPVKRNVELYFPNELFRDRLVKTSTQQLKLVIFETDNPQIRAESSWHLPLFRNK